MAEKSILVDVNLNGNIVKNAKLEILASAPSSPSAGRVYLNSTDGILYYYNGSAWVGSTEYDIVNSSSASGTYPVLDYQEDNLFYLKVLRAGGVVEINSADGIITISIVPDTEMSDLSTNVVRNSTIKSYIDNKVNLTALTESEVDEIFE